MLNRFPKPWCAPNKDKESSISKLLRRLSTGLPQARGPPPGEALSALAAKKHVPFPVSTPQDWRIKLRVVPLESRLNRVPTEGCSPDFHLIFTIIWWKEDRFIHFAPTETKARRGQLTCQGVKWLHESSRRQNWGLNWYDCRERPSGSQYGSHADTKPEEWALSEKGPTFWVFESSIGLWILWKLLQKGSKYEKWSSFHFVCFFFKATKSSAEKKKKSISQSHASLWVTCR